MCKQSTSKRINNMSEENKTISNGVKLVGETILPGTSLLLDGRIKEGAAHTAVGLAARVLMGPIGWGLAAANSYSKSVSGKSILALAGDVSSDATHAIKDKFNSKKADNSDNAGGDMSEDDQASNASKA